MFRRFVIITSLVAALAGTAAFAQRLSADRGRRDRIEALGGRRFERLQQTLNLTDIQMNGIRALQETRRAEMASLREEVQQKREALRQTLQANNPNPNEVGNATIALKETREKMRDINQRFMAGFKALLTPEQLQKLPKRLL